MGSSCRCKQQRERPVCHSPAFVWLFAVAAHNRRYSNLTVLELWLQKMVFRSPAQEFAGRRERCVVLVQILDDIRRFWHGNILVGIQQKWTLCIARGFGEFLAPGRLLAGIPQFVDDIELCQYFAHQATKLVALVAVQDQRLFGTRGILCRGRHLSAWMGSLLLNMS